MYRTKLVAFAKAAAMPVGCFLDRGQRQSALAHRPLPCSTSAIVAATIKTQHADLVVTTTAAVAAGDIVIAYATDLP